MKKRSDLAVLRDEVARLRNEVERLRALPMQTIVIREQPQPIYHQTWWPNQVWCTTNTWAKNPDALYG